MFQPPINLSKWQDYRASPEGSLFYLETAPYANLPIDDLLKTTTNDEKSEPDYEKHTFGLSFCSQEKLRSNFIRLHKSYVFFTTIYKGINQKYKGKHIIYGYMLVSNILNVQSRHRHKWVTKPFDDSSIPVCFDKKECFAFYGQETHFYSLEDSFQITSDFLKQWGYKGVVSRNMRINFKEESLQNILDYFKEKESINNIYAQEIREVISNKEDLLKNVEEEDEW